MPLSYVLCCRSNSTGDSNPVPDMLAPAIVEYLDVIEHIIPCLFARPIGFAADPLALKQIEEALCHRVVVAVPASAHRVLKIAVLQKGSPIHAGELGALIRVDQGRGLRPPSPHPHQQRLQHDVGELPALKRQANDAAGEQVDDHGQIGETLMGSDVGDVRHLRLVLRVDIEPSGQGVVDHD